MREVISSAPADTQAAPVADDRIASLDVLRGIALFGILLVNMAHFAWPTMYMAGAHAESPGGPIDHAVDTLIMVVGQGKFFPLFSFLFGLGLAIQFLSWQKKGAPTTRLFLRRLSFLLVIGFLHATLIWAGDILFKYAALGLMFFAVLRLPPRHLLVGAAGILGLPFLLGFLNVDVHLAALTGMPQTPAEYQALAAQSMAAYGQGSFLEMTAQRFTDFSYRLLAWPYASGLFTILAMFCLGAYAGRKQLFRGPVAARFRQGFVVSLGLWATCLGVFALSSALPGVVPPQATKVVKLLWNLSTTGIYITGVVLLLERTAWRERLAPLASTGRMALTNYLLQSVLATAVFYGTGLYGRLGSAACLGVTVAIFALQVVLSRYWMQRFRFGPVEWCWRWVTYGKRPPMRRPAPTSRPVTDLGTARPTTPTSLTG
jgi:uncharacterized protein